MSTRDRAPGEAADPIGRAAMLDRLPADHGAWDSESAEALARAYEAHDPDLVDTTPDADIDDDAGSRSPEQGLVARIRRSLADLRPESPLLGIETKIDAFDARISAAVRDVARRSDVEAVTAIERSVRDLAGRLDRVQSEVGRLDGLEQQLHHIADQLSEARLGAMLQRGDRSETELDEVARRAAAEMQARFAEIADADPRIDELRGLIERAIIEQRQGEESVAGIVSRLAGRVDIQTDGHRELRELMLEEARERRAGGEQQMSMLDTLQQALVTILDRVEAIETAHKEHLADLKRESAPASAPTIAAHKPEAVDRTHRQPTVGVIETEEALRYAAGVAGSAARAEAAAASQPTAEPQEQSATDKLRQDLIVEAQRAKLKAATRRSDAKPVTAAAKPAAAAKQAEASGGLLGIARLARFARGRAASLTLLALVATGASAAAVHTGLDLYARHKASLAAEPEITVSGAAQPAEADAVLQPAATEADPAPSTVATPSLHDAAEVEAAKGDPLMAEMAEQAGIVAATPAALTRDGGGAAPATIAPSARQRASALDLPPATVGPLSLRLAAANGDPSAEFEVAARLAEGKGTEQNFKEALRWYQRSASRGFAQAQYRLGTLYERGLGTDADPERARVWYQRAAEQGNIKAMHNLAVLIASANTTDPDYATATKWFTAAAEAGLADSQFNLAVLNESGMSIPRDSVTAYKWYSLAAAGGDSDAAKRRDEMKSELSAPDLAIAEQLASKFRAKPADPLANDPRVAGEDWKRRQADSNG